MQEQEMLQKRYICLQAHLPSVGKYPLFRITEKQFVSIKMLVDNPNPRKKKVNEAQFLLF